MSLAQNTSLNIQNIFQSIWCHLYDEEHSEYYYDDFTVCCGVNSFETKVTQSTAKEYSQYSTKYISARHAKKIQTLFTMLFGYFLAEYFIFHPVPQPCAHVAMCYFML